MNTITGKISADQKAKLDRVANAPKNLERLKKQQLDKDAFFRLFLEQLKHQDPTAPMDNSAMLQQMSQFSTMEQLGNMVKMQENMTKATEGVGNQLKELLDKIGEGSQNAEILAELKKMNLLLESYLPGKGNKKNAGGILEESGSTGGKGAGSEG